MRLSSKLIVGMLIGLAVGNAWLLSRERMARASGPMPQATYVWQRAWNGDTRRAVRESGSQFDSLLVLHAEAAWRRDRWDVVRVPVDFAALAASGRPVGLVLRIGPYGGPFRADDEPARRLVRLARDMIGEAREAGVTPAEVQLDFDCAESKLEGYCKWVCAVRSAISPTPLTITALPSWLDRAAFAELAAETDGYVLQVHAIRRPNGPNEDVKLCDAEDARRAVERAARLGRPFRVALPTYRYECAFDETGKLVGLRAEGRRKRWLEGLQRRELGAEPREMAALVAAWTRDRPACCRGIVWFRLPVDKDEMNWSRKTLVSVMHGRTPEPAVRAVAGKTSGRVTKVFVENAGDADGAMPRVARLVANGQAVVAADGLADYRWRTWGDGGVAFELTPSANPARLAPGERRAIGWIRWESDTEVQFHVETFP